MLVSARRSKPFVIALVAAMLGFPAAAVAADVVGPSVVRVDPATGASTVLAGGAPWSNLTGITVAPSGTVYVSNVGETGSGIYSLSAPGFAIAALATTKPTAFPKGVLASGTTLYTLDSGVLAIDTNAPFAQRVVSPAMVPCDPVCATPDPDYATLSGSTLYGTEWVECPQGEDTVGEGDAWVTAIDLATGKRSGIELTCDDELGPIAAAPDGTLLIAESVSGGPAQIIRLNPANEAITTVAKGGKLKSPQGLALAPSGDLIVADTDSGLLRINPATGAQSTIASGGDLKEPQSVALDAGGNLYVTVPGPTPVLKAAAPSRQRASSGRVRFSASCSPRCLLRYDLRFTGIPYTYDEPSDFGRVTAKKALKLTTAPFIKRQIKNALRRHRTVKAKLILTPASTTGGADGKSVSLTVKIVR